MDIYRISCGISTKIYIYNMVGGFKLPTIGW